MTLHGEEVVGGLLEKGKVYEDIITRNYGGVKRVKYEFENVNEAFGVEKCVIYGKD